MFQGIYEDLIVKHRFIVSFLFLTDLGHKEVLLNEGVVELSVCIAEFVIFDEKLETLSKSGLAAMVFGQWGHGLRMLDDKGGVQALRFQEAADQLINEPKGGPWVRAVHLVQLALGIKESLCFLTLQISGQGHSEAFLQLLHHGDSPPRRGEIDF